MFLVFDRAAKIPRTKQTARKPTRVVRRTLVPLDQVIAEQQVAAAVPLDQVIAEQQVAAATLVRAAEIAEAQRQHQLWLTSETAAARIETMVRFFISHFFEIETHLGNSFYKFIETNFKIKIVSINL